MPIRYGYYGVKDYSKSLLCRQRRSWTYRFRRLQQNGFFLALPTIAWLFIFFVLPLVIVLVVSFMSRGRGGVALLPFTLQHYERTFGVFFIHPAPDPSAWQA